MRFVDHDPAAAMAAAAACRDAADDLRARAGLLDGGMGAHLHAWAGVSRQGFDAMGDDLAAALRTEAQGLDTTADEIDVARGRAQRAEEDRREAHDAEQRRLERLAEESAG